jgi:hypothetical protein
MNFQKKPFTLRNLPSVLVERIGWVCLVYFLLLTAVILATHHYKEPRLWENGSIAHEIVGGRGFSAQFTDKFQPTSWQAPGYPYLLAYAWTWLGEKPSTFLLISLLQALALSLMFYPLQQLARRWFGPEAMVPITVVTLLMPLYAWYSTRLHHTALVMAVHPWLLWLWLSQTERKNLLSPVALGLLTGLAGLFQPVMLAVYGVIAAGGLLGQVLKQAWDNAGRILLAGVVTLVVLTPWTVRNYEVHGRLLLVKNSFGKEFWLGNNPHATGTGYVEGGDGEITNIYPPHCFEHRSQFTEMQMMDAMQAEAAAYVKSTPGEFIQRTAKKILWFWTLVPAKYLRSSGGGEALGFRWLHGGYWSLFLVLAAVSFFSPKSWPREYAACLLLYVFFYSLVYGLTHVGQARFRGEIEFILLPAVASGVHRLIVLFLPRRSLAQA